MSEYHSESSGDVIKILKSRESGLSSSEAKKRLSQHGSNELRTEKKKSLAARFINQFADFSIIVLFVAAAVSFGVSWFSGEKDITDTIVILAIVVINAIIGVSQESKAEKSLEALKKLSAPTLTVLRDEKEIKIPAKDAVPGDILLVSAGDMVGADARLIESIGLKTDESALTGESVPAEKESFITLKENTPTADRKNMIFSSTLVVSGHGKAVVTKTGMNTEIGRIAGMLTENSEETPLQKRLSSLSKILGIGALVCCAGIFILGVIRKDNILDSFMLAVSLAVAAIPEGLPAIVTIVLSMGVGNLARKNAIIRHLPSCETLGNATVICSDKTGTLTQNKMTVTDIRLPYRGSLSPDNSLCSEILKFGALCTNTTIRKRGKKQDVTGEPTETAIVRAALKGGFLDNKDNAVYKRIKEIPFDSSRKMMTTILRTEKGYITITKGSPQYVMKICTHIKTPTNVRAITAADIRSIENANSSLAKDALRVLGVAVRECGDVSFCGESGLTFLGLIGMEDPPRPEAIKSVEKCLEAGIKPVMITGDQVLTANTIAARLGILKAGDLTADGTELDKMSNEELKQNVGKIKVFARVTPEHKLRIIKAFKECGETVAMTGDGINDAPALKAADIGCAMGKSGTDVAKNASDMILTDDNFSTIVNAVETGRGLFDNIKKAVRFLLSCNIGEIMLIFMSSVLGFPSPLLPVQLLWLNLVTDSLPAMALGTEKAEKNIMKRKPLKKGEGIIDKNTAFDIAVEGMLFGVFALFAFSYGKNVFSLEVGRTMAFCTLSISELFHAFNLGTEKSIFTVSPFENPQLFICTVICILLQVFSVAFPFSQNIFNTVMLSKEQWLIVAALTMMSLVVTETEKVLTRRADSKAERGKVRSAAVRMKKVRNK